MTTQQQKFIGGLIAGALVKKGVEVAIDTAVAKVAKKANNGLDKSDAAIVAAEINAEVKKEMQARAEHATDTEPHRASRNLWGVLFGLMGEAAILYTYATDNVPQDFQAQIAPHILVIIGLLTPLYSRFIAKKPLFR